jgi:N6-adenosine-specific RNA methylase IME4
MSVPNPTQSAILYQSACKTVTLLDIPLSISLAQGTPDHPHRDRIYSSKPPQHPYPSTEPKSEKARKNVLRTMKESAGPAFPEKVLYEALEEIKANYTVDEWCLPRQVRTFFTPAQRRKKRKGPKDVVEDRDTQPGVVEPEMQIPCLDERSSAARQRGSRAMYKSSSNSFKDIQAIAYRLIHNPYDTSLFLSTTYPPQIYDIPSGSAFYLANIDRWSGPRFSSAAQLFYSAPTATAGPGQFDLILLDPPWDNRSAKRSGGYWTMCQDLHPIDVLVEVLSRHIPPDGVVACWITNNSSARTWIMEAFKTWDLELFEEWAWLKITARSIPVADIQGAWRKPYEILLLGRRRNASAQNTPQQPVRHRVIVAVPDVHSRKPCLKELLESVLPDPKQYRALEVFARSLTAGWCSWGNEVIRHNWQGCWAKTES